MYIQTRNIIIKTVIIVVLFPALIFAQSGSDDYQYDPNGNLIIERYKGIEHIEYNILDLPETILFKDEKKIIYTYTAAGDKISKTVINSNGIVISKKDYIEDLVYANDEIEFFQHAQGYAEPVNNGSFNYIYQHIDHLENIRISYSDDDKDGKVDPGVEVKETQDYYPFGLKLIKENNIIRGRDHTYGFGNKEEQEEFDLNWNDHGARFYDPALARWHVIDPLADDFLSQSPYNFAFNNPITYNDPDGMQPHPSDNDEDFRPYDLPTSNPVKDTFETFFPTPPNPDRIEEQVRDENKGASEDELNDIFWDTLEKKDLDFSIKVKSTELVFETMNEILGTFSVVPEPIIRVLVGLSNDDSDVLIRELEKLADDPAALSDLIPGPGGKIAKIEKLRRFIKKLDNLQYTIRNRTKRALKRNKTLRKIRKRKRVLTPIFGVPELPKATVKKLSGKKRKQLPAPKDPKPKN